MANKPQLLGYTSLLGETAPPVPSKWDRVKQALWESNLNAPVRGFYNLMNTPYDVLMGSDSPEKQQAVADSFDAAGGITVGSMPIPKPANSLTMGIKAYHGSPHSFDKFSMDKIGTGEGAQAYGHGLYFAENEGVARGYRDTLASKNAPMYLTNPQARGYLSKAGGDKQKAITLMEDDLYSAFPGLDKSSRAFKKHVEHMRDQILNYTDEIPPGHLYEVSINADPNAFLDWDKPLSEQPQHIQDAFKDIPQAPDIPGQLAYYRLGEKKLNNPEASAKLKEAGIPGIKYLDAGSRGKGVAHVQPMYKGKPYGDPVPATAWNQVDQLTQRYKDMGYDVEVKDLGTRNYVVFDDSLISIVRKYGIAGASAMLGYNLLEGVDKAQAAELQKADTHHQYTNWLSSGGI